jgi:AbrB family looped-hinge helix DNA binding protein
MFYKSITEGMTLIEEEMKVGSKGQVVIPRTMRKALKIEPGSKVLFTLEDDKLFLKKLSFDGVAAFKKIAEQIHSNEKVNPHEYKEELEQRNP